MNFRGHLIFGIIFLACLFILDKIYLHYFFVGISGAALIFFAPLILFSFLLPDVDHDDSIPKFVIMILLVAMVIYSILEMSRYVTIGLFVILILMWLLNWVPGWQHRGHAHSLIFIALITALVTFVVGWKIALIFALGALSHLIADDEIKIW